jgi:hypothetical protein
VDQTDRCVSSHVVTSRGRQPDSLKGHPTRDPAAASHTSCGLPVRLRPALPCPWLRSTSSPSTAGLLPPPPDPLLASDDGHRCPLDNLPTPHSAPPPPDTIRHPHHHITPSTPRAPPPTSSDTAILLPPGTTGRSKELSRCEGGNRCNTRDTDCASLAHLR